MANAKTAFFKTILHSKNEVKGIVNSQRVIRLLVRSASVCAILSRFLCFQIVVLVKYRCNLARSRDHNRCGYLQLEQWFCACRTASEVCRTVAALPVRLL